MSDEGRDQRWLAERFETDRSHLKTVAYRILGSSVEADDAVQDAWLRVSRADAAEVDNLTGWFTTIVARVCLNALSSRRSRREVPYAEPQVDVAESSDPEQDVLLADSLGPALLMVLDTLAPAERLAFVLHDLFAMPFDEVAHVLERSPAAARQLASRGRRRLQGAQATTDRVRQRQVVDAFLAASRAGDFAALLAILDPEVVLHADPVAVASAKVAAAQGAPPLQRELRGPDQVARVFAGRAQAAQPAWVDGRLGAVWAPEGRTRVVFDLTIHDERIVMVEVLADPTLVADLTIELI